VQITDIILLGLLVFGGGLGIRRGLFRELLGLVLLLGSAYGALALSGVTLKVVGKVFDLRDPARAEIIPWLVGFVALYVLALVAFFFLRKALRKLRFSGDRVTGSLIGVLRVVLLICLLLPGVAFLSPENGSVRRAVTGIRTWGWLRNGANRAAETPFLPPRYVEFVKDTPEIWK
jgi:uncharacterized membrane protein required for colicin V production